MKRFSFYNGMIAASITLILLVLLTELSAPIKTLLENVFTHHWIGKAVFVSLTFIIFGFMKEIDAAEKKAWYLTNGCLVAIFLFYLMNFVI